MRVMSATPAKKNKSIRTTPAAQGAFVRVMSHLQEAEGLRWRNAPLNQERTFEAIFLWLDRLDPKVIEDGVRELAAELAPRDEGLPEPRITERPQPPKRPAKRAQ